MDDFHRSTTLHYDGGCNRWDCPMCGPDRKDRVRLRRAARRRMRRELAAEPDPG